MATLKLSSTNEGFSYIIGKNPATGMIAKSVKHGTAFGWFKPDSTQFYCVAFFDGMDDVSFSRGRNESFSFIDSTKYNSPLFIASAIREFFNMPLSKVVYNEEEQVYDIAGYYNEIEITSVEIKRVEVIKKLVSCFSEFDISITELPHEEVDGVVYNNFSLKIGTNNFPIYHLLNLCYLLSYMIAICSHIDLVVEKAMLDKLINAANLLNAPYYVKHLIRCWCINSPAEFDRVVENLNFSNDHKLDISKNLNMLARLHWIKSQINTEIDVVDYGCGEGNFFSISTNIPNSMYYAIDRDEEVREAAQRRIDRKMYDNIILLDSLKSFISAGSSKNYIVIMSEMFEHNDLKDITKDLKTLMEDHNCSRIILTTPNKDFNKFYLLDEGELRLEDHKFEMTKEEATEYFTKLVEDTEFSVKITDLGDKVDDIPTIIGVILKKTIKGDK